MPLLPCSHHGVCNSATTAALYLRHARWETRCHAVAYRQLSYTTIWRCTLWWNSTQTTPRPVRRWIDAAIKYHFLVKRILMTKSQQVSCRWAHFVSDLFHMLAFVFSRSYCYTVWSAIGSILSSVCLSVCLSVCALWLSGSVYSALTTWIGCAVGDIRWRFPERH